MEIIKVQQRRKQLLDDTVYYYSMFPRCLAYNVDEEYFYPTLSGNTAGLQTAGDVLGRLLKPVHRDYLDDKLGEVPFEELFEELPQEIKLYGKDFLIELCCLHDNCSNWEEKELSEEGRMFVQEINYKFCKID